MGQIPARTAPLIFVVLIPSLTFSLSLKTGARPPDAPKVSSATNKSEEEFTVHMSCSQDSCPPGLCDCVSTKFDNCIHASWICDGFKDCDGGEDEHDCDYTTTTPATTSTTAKNERRIVYQSEVDMLESIVESLWTFFVFCAFCVLCTGCSTHKAADGNNRDISEDLEQIRVCRVLVTSQSGPVTTRVLPCLADTSPPLVNQVRSHAVKF